MNPKFSVGHLFRVLVTQRRRIHVLVGDFAYIRLYRDKVLLKTEDLIIMETTEKGWKFTFVMQSTDEIFHN